MARRRRVAIAHPTEKGHTEAGGHGLGAAARTGEDIRVREEAEELGAALAEEAQALLGDVTALRAGRRAPRWRVDGSGAWRA